MTYMEAGRKFGTEAWKSSLPSLEAVERFSKMGSHLATAGWAATILVAGSRLTPGLPLSIVKTLQQQGDIIRPIFRGLMFIGHGKQTVAHLGAKEWKKAALMTPLLIFELAFATGKGLNWLKPASWAATGAKWGTTVARYSLPAVYLFEGAKLTFGDKDVSDKDKANQSLNQTRWGLIALTLNVLVDSSYLFGTTKLISNWGPANITLTQGFGALAAGIQIWNNQDLSDQLRVSWTKIA
jgi:hypothetical protein